MSCPSLYACLVCLSVCLSLFRLLGQVFVRIQAQACLAYLCHLNFIPRRQTAVLNTRVHRSTGLNVIGGWRGRLARAGGFRGLPCGLGLAHVFANNVELILHKLAVASKHEPDLCCKYELVSQYLSYYYYKRDQAQRIQARLTFVPPGCENTMSFQSE